jgi:transposase
MRRKPHATDLSSEEVVKDIRRATRKRYSAEEKIRIVLAVCAASTRLPSCAVAKALPRAFTTAGRRSFSKPASGGSPATPPAPPPATRSRHRAVNSGSERGGRRAGAGTALAQKSMIADGGDEA